MSDRKKKEPEVALCHGCQTGNYQLCRSFPGIVTVDLRRDKPQGEKQQIEKKAKTFRGDV